MTNEEAAKIAATIREQADYRLKVTGGTERDAHLWATDPVICALRTTALEIADIYAVTQRVPESARQGFMIACGL